MFFKRLSRGSRSNSYVNDDDNNYSTSRSAPPQEDSPRQSLSQHNTYNGNGVASSPTKESQRPDSQDRMFPRSQAPSDPYSRAQQPSNGMGNGRNSIAMDGPSSAPSKPAVPPPDLLTQAFHQAVLPYTEKIADLEAQVAEMQQWVENLEQQRSEVHSWIDKRGLRPDVPPSIAKIMDSQPDAAQTLNAQLDRKITIVNFDLHRLQDDLNDSISSSHFASAMTKFLPDIARLSALPTGPRFAFDLVLKLGGNLNSHGGLDSHDPADISARRDFYAKLDQAMVDVVQRRFSENEDWPVGREIKRIEKTAAYLRNFGVEPYFPSTLDAMRREVDYRQAGPVPPQAHSPPRTLRAANRDAIDEARIQERREQDWFGGFDGTYHRQDNPDCACDDCERYLPDRPFRPLSAITLPGSPVENGSTPQNIRCPPALEAISENETFASRKKRLSEVLESLKGKGKERARG